MLLVFGARDVTAADFAGLLLGMTGQIALALPFAIPLQRWPRYRWIVYVLLLPVVFLNIAAFHYEATFWRLPGVALFYYLREAAHLASSTSANAPIAALILELVVVMAILILAERRRPRRLTWRRPAATIVVASVIATLIIHASPSLIPRPILWRARTPLLWAAQSAAIHPPDDKSLSRADIFELQRKLGHPIPFGSVDPTHPLCGAGPRDPSRTGNGRSVIFLILESVGVHEMTLVHRGQRVMPNLNRIAAESVFFPDVKASGAKSLQALPSLIAGIPPQPAANLLWRQPLNHVEGFPLLLRQRGYRTAYFHGGDLSFEQQRPFLRMAGFEELHELDLAAKQAILGWGQSDDIVFARMRTWIESTRRPYLATLFTLSTHDPFVLPPNRRNVFPAIEKWDAFAESLRFADEQLGAFYDWYVRVEKPRGTLLVITADHAPHLTSDRFEMPLLIAGDGAPRVDRSPAAQFDIPATILGLLDLSPGPCDQGVDLLSGVRDRYRYAVSGDQLEEFHLWTNGTRVDLDLSARDSRVTSDRALSEDEKREATQRAIDFYQLARRASSALIAGNGFAPRPPTVRIDRKPLPTVTRPFFVAHRGQSRGEVAADRQNKRETIEQAIADGFEWVEVDVNITRDRVPVVVHDPVISLTLDELRAKPGMSDVMTLDDLLQTFGDRVNLLVEVKPQRSYPSESLLAFRSAFAVRERKTAKLVIMDSFSPFIAASLAQHCRCEAGNDAPRNRALDSRWVDSIALAGLHWVYVDHRQASAGLIRYAHQRGLKVLVYTVNNMSELARLGDEWPDAIITDRAGLVREFDAR